MKATKTEREKDTELLRQQQKKSLANPQLDDKRKQFWKRDIEIQEWELEQLPKKWVELLAATGNPESKPLCLELLSASYPDSRLSAIRALAHAYDDQTATALITACTQEKIAWVAEEIFDVLGEHGNASTANQMMKLIEQPTRVSFKLNWLEAMKKLAPERVRPIAQEWTSSPNQQLSTAAREFLAKMSHT